MNAFFALDHETKEITRLNALTASRFALDAYGHSWSALWALSHSDAEYISKQLIPAGVDGWRFADKAQVQSFFASLIE